MKLIRYRDAELSDYIYYWVTIDGHMVSPNFCSEEEAQEWFSLVTKNWDAYSDLPSPGAYKN